MAKNLQVRDLDEDVIAELKARAARARQSLSAYAGQILAESVARPTPDDLRERLKALQDLGGGAEHDDIVDEIRRIREA
ncbi:FitA-like ribbon-helix-helix domain-containing protein [Glycomyces halotolerans]